MTATVADGLARTTTYELDSAGHITEQIAPDGTISQTWGYGDRANVLTQFTDWDGNTTQYSWDGYPVLDEIITPDGGSVDYSRGGGGTSMTSRCRPPSPATSSPRPPPTTPSAK